MPFLGQQHQRRDSNIIWPWVGAGDGRVSWEYGAGEMNKIFADSNNALAATLPTDPDELARLMDAEEMAAENASAGIRRRAWHSYLKVLADLNLDTEE